MKFFIIAAISAASSMRLNEEPTGYFGAKGQLSDTKEPPYSAPAGALAGRKVQTNATEPVQPDLKHTKEWMEYRNDRGEHDCSINEMNNWFGATRCIESFECTGARMCTGGDGQGKKEQGWCTGDSSCPNMGPLDFHDEKGDVVWNHKVKGTWDQPDSTD